MIRPLVRTNFHHHTRGKLYAANYQLAAAMQQMGCGPADILHLCGFLSLPGGSIIYHIRRTQEILGPIRITNREASERDAVDIEIEAAKK